MFSAGHIPQSDSTDCFIVFGFQGETSFFLMPGEKLEKGIQNVFILGEDEGLIIKANESFKDKESVRVIPLCDLKKSLIAAKTANALLITW